MMKRSMTVFLILSMVLVLPLWPATTGKIAGRVVDAETGMPLAGANIIIEGTNRGTAADKNGYYTILNVSPGTYTLRAMMMGYGTLIKKGARVSMNLTTTVNFELSEQVVEGQEVIVVADRPIVQKDIASSQANLNVEDIEALPVVNISQVVGMEAGISGLSIRGGGSSQTNFMMNGFSMRDERDNTPYTAISFTSVDEIQIQTGGFSAEFGNIRSGQINVVTKEGKRDAYHFGLISRYSPASPKHFGHSPNSPESYWIRPYVDEDVCWTGTGAWDAYTRNQYPDFEGWNAISAKTLLDDNPDNDLTPWAAQQLFLWEHRRQLDIQKADYDIDASFGGPVPLLSKELGGLRFFSSYRRSRNMYVVPLSDDASRDYSGQLKLTSNITKDMKLTIEGLTGRVTGTNDNNSGLAGIFSSAWGIASSLSRGPRYIDGRMFGTDYWCPSTIDRSSIGLKLNHVLNSSTFYEVTLQRFASAYNTNPGAYRDTSRVYLFGNNYYVDEAPFGYYDEPANGIGSGMRMGVGMSNSRDTSRVAVYTARFDITSQLDRFNNLKAGIELNYTDNNVNYASFDKNLTSGNQRSVWHTYPVRGALYVQDKLEFSSMIATLGLRLDYSHAGGKWFDYDNPWTDAFSAANASVIDTLLDQTPTKHIFSLSPRIGVAFPISIDSKLFFNYGHFRQMPTPENLFLIRRYSGTQALSRLANPNNPLPRTVAYELGYEHNLFDQFLLRVAGYYKDSNDQSRLVTYANLKNTVSYAVTEPNSYQDTRGFEFTLRKNRGKWVQGFFNYTYEVTTAGYFGFGTYYENPSQQRQYEAETRSHYQEKPVPRPFARLNLDFFLPERFGPRLLGVHPLEGWRLNVLANWRAGVWATWTGGGFIPGIVNNVQWRDYWNLDLRFSKDFRIGKSRLEFFVDISNVTNYQYMASGLGFADAEDYNAYMKSLHLPAEIGDQLGYTNVAGDDRPGDYRTVSYEAYDPNDPDKDRQKRILDTKAYIDMPNLKYFTFLNPRNWFWGVKLSFDI